MTDSEARAVVLMIEDRCDEEDVAQASCRTTNAGCATHRFLVVHKADIPRGWYVAVEVVEDSGEKEEPRD